VGPNDGRQAYQPYPTALRESTTLDLYTRRTDDPSRVLRALDDETDEEEPTTAKKTHLRLASSFIQL
jgi:hypothetical protein